MKHYSVLLVVQDHSDEIPGLFLVSILETEPHSPEELDGDIKVSAFKRFLVAWDGKDVDLITWYSHGTHQAMPDERAFDIAQVVEDYVHEKEEEEEEEEEEKED